jgi:aspartate aminotransferase
MKGGAMPPFFNRSPNQHNIRSSGQLCEALRQETGMAILPGTEFGRPATNLTAHPATVDFDGAKALQAV